MAVVRIIAPVAIVIEIFITNHIVGQIARRTGVVVAPLTALSPSVKLVRVTDLLHVGIQRVAPAERSSLPGMDRVSLPVACGLALSVSRSNHRVAAIFACLEAVVPGPLNAECQIGRVDFNGIVLIKPPHANIYRSGCKLDLDCVVIKIQKRAAGVFA
jgi:hypothetical protein